jgi:ABC-2 type transport system permease protein
MNKTLIILSSELKGTLKRKGFIITTLALPVLALLAMLVFQVATAVMQPSSEAESLRIGFVDQAGYFDQIYPAGRYSVSGLYFDRTGHR